MESKNTYKQIYYLWFVYINISSIRGIHYSSPLTKNWVLKGGICKYVLCRSFRTCFRFWEKMAIVSRWGWSSKFLWCRFGLLHWKDESIPPKISCPLMCFEIWIVYKYLPVIFFDIGEDWFVNSVYFNIVWAKIGRFFPG